MIFDTIDNAPHYFKLHPHFEAAFKWLEENPNPEEGRYEISGDDCFVMIQTPSGRGTDSPIIEAHNQYIDIQLSLEGTDVVGWKARNECSQVKQEYSQENDVILWSEAPASYFNLAPGTFTILYPHDAHAPLSGEGPLKKAVFKIRF